ncbi:MAG: hypothetical protein NC312_09120 [Bacteroides fragilis]|nr:hypothetical protein [Bacteroides fragilis]
MHSFNSGLALTFAVSAADIAGWGHDDNDEENKNSNHWNGTDGKMQI